MNIQQKVLLNISVLVILLTFGITAVAQDLTITHANSLYTGSESVDFSPNGNYIATGDIDGDVGFWEIGNSEALVFKSIGGEVEGVAFSPGGSYLAADGNDGNVRAYILDVPTGNVVRSTYIDDDAGNINAIDYSPDGSYVAVAVDLFRAYIWNLQTSRVRGWGILNNSSEIYDVAFSPDGKYLATGDDVGGLVLWELDSWWGNDVDSNYFGIGGNVQAVAFSPDGKYLAADGYDEDNRNNYVNIYNMSNFSRNWQIPTNSVYSIAFSPDSEYIAIGDSVDTITFYQIGTDVTYVENIRAGGIVYDLAWSPDGSLISDGRDVWNVIKPSEPLTDATQNKIYWVDRSEGKIFRSNLDGSDVEVVKSGLSILIGIALDISNGKIYWTERGVDKIRRANLNGSNVEDILTGLDDPYNIRLDVSGGKMYWIEIGSDKIRRANLNGSSVEDIVNTGLEIDGGIALDTTNGKMYWADWHNGSIHRYNLNGSSAEVLLTGLNTPIGVALDVSYDKMYWAEQGSDKIRRANLNGTNVEDLVTSGLANPFDIVLDTINGKIYWSDLGTDKIQRANLDGSGVEDILLGLEYPLGIALDLSHSMLSPITVSLSPSSVASPNVGEQLTFSLNIAEGQNVAGYQATVQFDTTALSYVQSDNGTYLPSGAFFVPPQVEGNTVQLAATSLAGETMGDGTLANITFEVVAVKASTVRLSNVILTDSLGGSSTPQTENAEITEPQQLPEDVNKDGIVNIIDLTLVASNFGKTGTNIADVNGDGIVNIIDLTLVAAAFGSTAAPSIWSQNTDDMPTRAMIQQWLQEARQLNLTDPDFQRGILVLENLLKALTPKETALLPNYPNPFNPETWIPYQIASPADVSISIYSADGKLIRTLDIGYQPVGIYQHRSNTAHWDGKNAQGEPVASGVYFYTLTAGDFTATRKMLIRK